MMRVKCIVTYDGSQFFGFQVQNNARTVQGEIQKAIGHICKDENIIIHSSGRTDAKVHGIHQVFHFDTHHDNIAEKQWKRAINHFLPDDIYIVDTFVVSEQFHSRYSAVKKEYHYRLNMNEYDPFQRDYVFQYGRPLNIELMKDAASIFIGEHDFASFCANDEYGNTIRTIYQIDIVEDNGIVTFKLTGNGFRRYMVRHIVGGLIQVGAQRKDKAFLKTLLDSRGQKKCLFKAKPQGLYLYEVYYE